MVSANLTPSFSVVHMSIHFVSYSVAWDCYARSHSDIASFPGLSGNEADATVLHCTLCSACALAQAHPTVSCIHLVISACVSINVSLVFFLGWGSHGPCACAHHRPSRHSLQPWLLCVWCLLSIHLPHQPSHCHHDHHWRRNRQVRQIVSRFYEPVLSSLVGHVHCLIVMFNRLYSFMHVYITGTRTSRYKERAGESEESC